MNSRKKLIEVSMPLEAINKASAREKSIRCLTSAGWATFLQGPFDVGYVIDGTWPVRTELSNRNIGQGANALASSIVLVCRKRAPDAPVITRRDYIARLRSTLPGALAKIREGDVGPVDMAQAAIGPGMGLFTAAAKVLETDDSPMTVRTAIALINQTRAEIPGEEATGYDPDTRFCIDWFDNFDMAESRSGDAITMAQAYGIGIKDLDTAGVFVAKGGTARLLRREEPPTDWDPGGRPPPDRLGVRAASCKDSRSIRRRNRFCGASLCANAS